MHKFGFVQQALSSLIRNRSGQDHFKPRGRFNPIEHWRDGRLFKIYDINNDITNQGKNVIFNVMFNGATATGASGWYMGLINNASYTGVAATDTMASHSGWTEFASYSGGARPAWGPGSSSAQSVTNASAATFNITGTGTVQGVFIVNDSTLSGTAGSCFWATALFSSPVAVNTSDQIKATYTVSA